jgi:phosphohistidine phosphatase
MKTLLLIRHAKSSWEGMVDSDFDRPLNSRGKKDAPEMAMRLLQSKIKVDIFISSPAKRAKMTAYRFIKEFKRNKNEILFIPSLYEAGVQVFYDVVYMLDNACNSAALFSHNPGITEFVNTLTEVRLDNMPTCGIFGVRAPVEKWNGFAAARKEFLFFDYPKLGLDNP